MFCKRPTIIKNEFISSLVATCGIFMGISFILPMGNFSVYLTSYIHEKQDFVTMYYGLFINLISAFAMTAGMSIGGFLELKLGLILTTLSGLVIILIGNIFFLNVQNIWLCYVLTFVVHVGAGIANSLNGKNLALYKPEKKGMLVSGIFALAVLFAGPLALMGEKIINPDGYTLQGDEEYYSYKYSSRTYLYFTIGFFTIPLGAIIFLLFIVVYKPPKKSNELNDIYQNISNEKENEEDKENNNKNEEGEIINEELKSMSNKKKIKKVIKTFRFWRLSIAQLLISFSFSFILGTGRTFGAIIGIEGGALQFLMLLQSLALLIIGPLVGFLVDKKGPLNLLRAAALICVIPGVLLTFFTTNTFFFIFSFLLGIIGMVSMVVCFSPFIMEVYGIQESVILGGIMNVFSKLSEIITTVSGFVISLYYTKDEIIRPYQAMYIIGSICCLVSFVLFLFEKMDKFNYEIEEESLDTLVENARYTEANWDINLVI